MKKHTVTRLLMALFVMLFMVMSSNVYAEAEESADTTAASANAGKKSPEEIKKLAQAAQNPVAPLIQLPIQYNLNFPVGSDKVGQSIVIEPVIPVKLTKDWNLILRPIMPIEFEPSHANRDYGDYGMGDINLQMYFTPSKPSKLIWAIGPSWNFPSATDTDLGTEQFSVGPGLVLMTMPGHWVIGGLINTVWSYAGNDERDDVIKMTIQPIINYNLVHGWYLATNPEITANFADRTSNRWNIPLGAGIGRVFHVGKQAFNARLMTYYRVQKPAAAADWQVQLQVTLLFPEK